MNIFLNIHQKQFEYHFKYSLFLFCFFYRELNIIKLTIKLTTLAKKKQKTQLNQLVLRANR